MNRITLTSHRRTWLILALILLLAGGLRFFRIDAQSFWNDEGNSARLAERSVDLILAGARGDIHPPGYYLALHYWRALLGPSEAALRGLSAVCSLALVLFAFLTTRRLFADGGAGLAAAALVAVNPFQIYYAQEARMYAMLALWTMVSTWALVAWLSDISVSHSDNVVPGREVRHRSARLFSWPLLAYVLAAAAGLYTHYAFPFVLLAQNLGLGLWLALTRAHGDVGRRLALWVGAQLAVVLLYLPWLPTAWHQVTSWSAGHEPYRLPDALGDIWRLLNFGRTVPTEQVAGGLVAAGALVFLSLLPPVEEEERADPIGPYPLRWGLLALSVLAPVGLILGLGLYKPAYQKFLLVAAAPLSGLVGRGAVGGWRIASGAGVWGEGRHAIGYRAVMLFVAALLLFDTGRSLNNLYFDQSYARSGYRAIARYIETQARPGDAILLNAPNQWEVFTYYYPDDEHVFPLARQRPFNEALNRAELEQIVADHERLFVIYWGEAESDPERFIERWLEAHTYKAAERWYGDVRLATYAVPAELADRPKVPSDVRFVTSRQGPKTQILLDGYTLLTDRLAPGDILQLALFWRTREPVVERYKVFVHLYDEGGRIVAQTDREPGATLRPTDTWSPGERVVDRYGVLIPPEAAAGTYTLAVGLYDLEDPSDRLLVVQDETVVGDRWDLAQVVVAGND